MKILDNYTAVLQLLQENPAATPLSGEHISRRLGISRAAVWKHIKTLREKGYIIDASPKVGYHLISVPNIIEPTLISNNIQTEILGRKILFYHTVGSTNREAVRLAENGAPDGSVIIAEEQHEGRGRRGRSWYSPAGLGLWMSFILRPTDKSPDNVSPLTAVIALAVAVALRRVTALPVMIKWPNDLLINGLKTGGILAELKGEPEVVHHIVAGLGININHAETDFPSYLSKIATSLKIAGGKSYQRNLICQVILTETDQYYRKFLAEGFGPFRDAWIKHSTTPGQLVTVAYAHSQITGIARDIDMTGALILEDEQGGKHRFTYGEIL